MQISCWVVLCNLSKELSPELVRRQSERGIRYCAGGFKLVALHPSTGISTLPDVTITSLYGCQTPTRHPQALAAPLVKSSIAQPHEKRGLMFCRLSESLPRLKNRSFFHYSRFNSAPSHHLYLRFNGVSYGWIIVYKTKTTFLKCAQVLRRWIAEHRQRMIQGQADKAAGCQTMTQ